MICENIFCIYWKDEKCLLKEICLDIQGNCKNCIYVDIDETLLLNQRQKLLNKYCE